MWHLPDVDLAHRHVGGVGVRVPARVPSGGELRDCDATIDPLAGLLEGEESAVYMLEGDEAVALGLTGLLVEDDHGLLELSVGREQGAEAVRGGVPTESADEELALRRVRVRQGSHAVKHVNVAGSRGRHDVEELVLVDAVDDFTDVFGGEFRDRGIDVGGGGDDAVLVQLSLLGRVHWRRSSWLLG